MYDTTLITILSIIVYMIIFVWYSKFLYKLKNKYHSEWQLIGNRLVNWKFEFAMQSKEGIIIRSLFWPFDLICVICYFIFYVIFNFLIKYILK